jgi:hypothetical protein
MGVSTNSRNPERSTAGKGARQQKYLDAVGSFMAGYAKFIKAHAGKFDFYVTFDYITHCPTIYKVTHQLQEMGIRPIPTYHGDMSIDWMQRYVDEGHKLIGIGGTPGNKTAAKQQFYYDQVFNFATKRGIYLHGFGQTSPRFMFGYPWMSVDSTSWLKPAAFGRILLPVPGGKTVKLASVIVSEWRLDKTLSEGALGNIVEEVERRGFSFEDMKTKLSERALFNAVIFQEISHGQNYQPRVEWKPLV